METIRVTTWMDAPMERCFRLATSIDLHLVSAAQTRETAIDGVTSGEIGEGQSVVWRGRHFGRWVTHTNKVDGWRPFSYFREVMTKGWFARFEHEHHFAIMDDGTRMRDEIRFSAPHGWMGGMVAKMVRRHLIGMLRRRNALIKRVAETEEWHKYLERSVVVPSAVRVATESRAHRWDKSVVGG